MQTVQTNSPLNTFLYRIFRATIHVELRKSNPQDSQRDLERLARTSPRLMRDIGFELDSDGTWTNGTTRVPSDWAHPLDIELRAGRF